MNEQGKVQVDQSEVLMAVAVGVVLQLRFLDDSGLGESIFQLLKLLQKIYCSIWRVFVLRLFQDSTVLVSGSR